MAPFTANERRQLSIRNGRPLNVAFTLNGKYFDLPVSVLCQDTNGIDQLQSKLFLHLNTKSYWSTVTLRVSGFQDLQNLGSISGKPQLHHPCIVFEGLDIRHWQSSPVSTTKGAKEMIRQQFKVSKDYPEADMDQKRIIKFAAQNCTIHGDIIPKLENSVLEKQMKAIIEAFDNARKKKKDNPLKLVCVVDEYREDAAVFKTFGQAEMEDKWLKPGELRNKGAKDKQGKEVHCDTCMVSGEHVTSDCKKQVGRTRTTSGWERTYCARCRIIHSTRGCNPKMIRSEAELEQLAIQEVLYQQVRNILKDSNKSSSRGGGGGPKNGRCKTAEA